MRTCAWVDAGVWARSVCESAEGGAAVPYLAVTSARDLQLALALVHDAGLLCNGSDDVNVARVKDLLGRAEVLLSGGASDRERDAVQKSVQASTWTHFGA